MAWLSFRPGYRVVSNMALRATDEQITVCTTPLVPGDLMMINAYAGTGKTTTLEILAEENPGKMFLYLCFNKDMATEAQLRFGGANVACRTTHSLAFQTHGIRYKDKLGTILLRDIVSRYSVDPRLAGLARKTFLFFLSQPGEAWPPISSRAVDIAKQIWEDAKDTRTNVPMPHDGYLKLWSLSNVIMDEFDYILVDEAQDSNPIIMDFAVRQARNKTSRVIMVGDTHQAIYSWRGAVDAMLTCPHISHTANLTNCFRFPQSIANYASAFLAEFKNDIVELKGIGGLRNDKSFAVISRTNTALVEHAWDLVNTKNMKLHFSATTSNQNYKPEQPYQHQMIREVLKLQAGIPTTHPTLRKYRDFEELEQYATGKYEGQQRDQDAIEAEIAVVVALVKNYGSDLTNMLDHITLNSMAPKLAHVSLSSAHRAKGQEWDNVKLAEDFYNFHDPLKRDEMTAEDANIIYVAITRSRGRLVLPEAYQEWFDQYAITC
jgi:F-box protein 18 (helicase)